MYWIKEVEMATSIDDLETSTSTFGQKYPNFEMLDARIATGLRKLISNSNSRERERSSSRIRNLRKGTDFFVEENFFMLNEHFRMTGTHETRLNVNDHINVQLRGDDVQGFDTMWDDVLLSIQEVPSDSILESFLQYTIDEV